LYYPNNCKICTEKEELEEEIFAVVVEWQGIVEEIKLNKNNQNIKYMNICSTI
jgi:hypothetical protein